MDLDLKGRIALVTGASKGIGRAVALKLAQEGCDAMLVARNEAELREAARAIAAETGRRIEFAAADLRAAAGAEAVVAKLKNAFGRIDILVNNAGTGRAGEFLKTPDDEWLDRFALKFFGCVRMCRLLWPMLKESKGAVVNMGGTGYHQASHLAMIGGAMNAAVANFSKALANLGLIDDVNVNSIHPGVIEGTELDERNMARLAEIQGRSVDDIRRTRLGPSGIRRAGTPEDVAAMVAFLVSPIARHIQGTAAVVDGGAYKGR